MYPPLDKFEIDSFEFQHAQREVFFPNSWQSFGIIYYEISIGIIDIFMNSKIGGVLKLRLFQNARAFWIQSFNVRISF